MRLNHIDDDISRVPRHLIASSSFSASDEESARRREREREKEKERERDTHIPPTHTEKKYGITSRLPITPQIPRCIYSREQKELYINKNDLHPFFFSASFHFISLSLSLSFSTTTTNTQHHHTTTTTNNNNNNNNDHGLLHITTLPSKP